MINKELDAAIENYQMAIGVNPEAGEAHLRLADLLAPRFKLEDAAFHYSYGLRLIPGHADGHAKLARVYEMLGRISEGRESANTALRLQPGHIGALVSLGIIEKRDKNYVEAKNIFRDVLHAATGDSVISVAAIELGHVLDRLGLYDDAYEQFVIGKAACQQLARNMPFDRQAFQKRIVKNRQYFTHDHVSKWDNTAGVFDKSRPAPIFFVGFPRSGTTLVEQVLDQHERVVTSDEVNFVWQTIEKIPALLEGKNSYPDCMQDLSADEVKILRNAYWQQVENALDTLEENSLLLDKLPLNLVNLGFVGRVFPDAHVLVALRDPRDVCLSCFMQGFTPNSAMANFFSMESTTRFYHQVMALWLHDREVLPFKWYQYRYEDLVDDFDSTTRGIFRFLELDYPENAANYHSAAINKMISTPSYQDVTTPIYDRSKARWKGYERYLAPYKDQLALFINEFGYGS